MTRKWFCTFLLALCAAGSSLAASVDKNYYVYVAAESLIQGLPKLKKITTTSLVEEKTGDLPNAVFSEISIGNLQAYIPDLCDLTRIIELAAYDN